MRNPAYATRARSVFIGGHCSSNRWLSKDDGACEGTVGFIFRFGSDAPLPRRGIGRGMRPGGLPDPGGSPALSFYEKSRARPVGSVPPADAGLRWPLVRAPAPRGALAVVGRSAHQLVFGGNGGARRGYSNAKTSRRRFRRASRRSGDGGLRFDHDAYPGRTRSNCGIRDFVSRRSAVGRRAGSRCPAAGGKGGPSR